MKNWIPLAVVVNGHGRSSAMLHLDCLVSAAASAHGGGPTADACKACNGLDGLAVMLSASAQTVV